MLPSLPSPASVRLSLRLVRSFCPFFLRICPLLRSAGHVLLDNGHGHAHEHKHEQMSAERNRRNVRVSVYRLSVVRNRGCHRERRERERERKTHEPTNGQGGRGAGKKELSFPYNKLEELLEPFFVSILIYRDLSASVIGFICLSSLFSLLCLFSFSYFPSYFSILSHSVRKRTLLVQAEKSKAEQRTSSRSLLAKQKQPSQK